MPIIIGIRFKDSGKIYFFDPNGVAPLDQGDPVIVETVRGPELARVAHAPRTVDNNEIVGELKPVLRRAEAADFDRMELLNERHDEVLSQCAEKIRDHDLPMRLVKAEYSFDGSRLTFYFTAEKRVDFRMLVRDLARTFKTRIELRQIGPRDEAKLLGGIGPCGRLLCCATFLPDYARVSIKMAKDQDLPLNPSKISGVCGRLLCCLSYEHEQYLDIKAELPKRGSWVQTPDGPGEVVHVNVVRETVTVALGDTGVQEEYTPAQVQEATERVGTVARSRNAEGITPLAGFERGEGSSRREGKHHGERRPLRNEIDNPEVLDALALLEEGSDDWHDGPSQPPRQRSHGHQQERRDHPQQRGDRPRSQSERGPSHQQERGHSPQDRNQSQHGQPSRKDRDIPAMRRRPNRPAPAAEPPLPEPPALPLHEQPGTPEDSSEERARRNRRRRKRGQ